MTGDAPPLRVGLYPSVGRFGLHLIERFAGGGQFRIVAALDEPAASDLIAPFGARLLRTPEELMRAEDIDVVWGTSYCGFRDDFALEGPGRGKHTIVETPLALTTEMANKAFGLAAEHDRRFLVHHPRRADLDFRQALSVAQDRAMGAIRAAKFVSWGYGLPPRGAVRGSGPLALDASDDPLVTKIRFVAHALDQLVPLVSDRPVRVFATGGSDLLNGCSLALRIVFQTGAMAEIDVRLDSPVPFQSGWTLTSERGGYANGRRYTLTEDGEVFDSPVSLADSDAESDQFEWLAQEIRSNVPNAAEEARVRTVVAILDAAQRSLATKQAVSV